MMTDETAEAQQFAKTAACHFYDCGDDVRVTSIDAVTDVFQVGEHDKVDTRIWDISVEVPGTGTRKLVVMHNGQTWRGFPTAQD